MEWVKLYTEMDIKLKGLVMPKLDLRIAKIELFQLWLKMVRMELDIKNSLRGNHCPPALADFSSYSPDAKASALIQIQELRISAERRMKGNDLEYYLNKNND